MDDEQTRLEGRKNVVLVDCEYVHIQGGKWVTISAVDQIMVQGCINASAAHNIWDTFEGNTVLDGSGNTFKVPRRVLTMSKA